jgi:hypothetical protein
LAAAFGLVLNFQFPIVFKIWTRFSVDIIYKDKVGGIVMFFVLKDEDRGRAKGGLKLGIILTAIGFVLWLLIVAAIAATVPSSTTSAYYYP